VEYSDPSPSFTQHERTVLVLIDGSIPQLAGQAINVTTLLGLTIGCAVFCRARATFCGGHESQIFFFNPRFALAEFLSSGLTAIMFVKRQPRFLTGHFSIVREKKRNTRTLFFTPFRSSACSWQCFPYLAIGFLRLLPHSLLHAICFSCADSTATYSAFCAFLCRICCGALAGNL